MLKTCIRMTVLVCLIVAAASPAGAQTPAANPSTGTLIVTVTDQTGAVLPSASVTISGQETSTRANAMAPAVASASGVARFESLAMGRTPAGGVSRF